VDESSGGAVMGFTLVPCAPADTGRLELADIYINNQPSSDGLDKSDASDKPRADWAFPP